MEDSLCAKGIQASLIRIIRTRYVHETINSFKLDWQVGWKSPKEDEILQVWCTKFTWNSFSSFYDLYKKNCWLGYDCVAILSIVASALKNAHVLDESFEFITRPFSWTSSSNLIRGTPIYIIGSPHGLQHPKAFLNYTFHGTISNLFLSKDNPHEVVVMMSDSMCLPGCEGGAVYSQDGLFLGVSSRSNEISRYYFDLQD